MKVRRSCKKSWSRARSRTAYSPGKGSKPRGVRQIRAGRDISGGGAGQGRGQAGGEQGRIHRGEEHPGGAGVKQGRGQASQRPLKRRQVGDQGEVQGQVPVGVVGDEPEFVHGGGDGPGDPAGQGQTGQPEGRLVPAQTAAFPAGQDGPGNTGSPGGGLRPW